MRKIISILLLCIIFSAHIGYYLVYTYQQYQLRETAKQRLFAGLPDSSFEIIVAGQHSSFAWEEEGKEFYLEGQLYDVAKSVHRNGKLLLYCINDKKEEELLCREGRAAGSGKNGKQVLKIQLIGPMQESPINSQRLTPQTAREYYYFDAPLIALNKEVKGPPPRA